MDSKSNNNRLKDACAEYEPFLEDYVCEGFDGTEGKRLAEHLRNCALCRAAVEDAAAGLRLLRTAGPLLGRAGNPAPAFSRVVMAHIRAEVGRREERSIWRPVVWFGWRLAMSAGVALAILVAYANTSTQPAQSAGSVQGVEARDLFSDPAINPATNGEVLMVVAENNNAER